MSLINKMLQDLDKRHAADGAGKSLTQQLRPVQTRKDLRRIMWEIVAGLVIGTGWALWVAYQISPRPIVTDLAFQPQPKRAPVAAVPAPPPQAAPAPAVQSVPSAPAALPAKTEPVKVDMLKLATEIATPFREKNFGDKAAPVRKPQGDAAAKAREPRSREAKAASDVAARPTPGPGADALAAADRASIDKRMHVGTATERAELEYAKATSLLNQGRVAEAMEGYRSALGEDAGHGPARQALVGLLLENRRIDEAQRYLQEGLKLDPNRANYAMLLARIQVERGDVQGAHELLAQRAASAAGNAEYYAFDAALLQRLGRHKEAVGAYQVALRLAPQSGIWWMGMGISLQADSRANEALEAFRRAKAVGGLSPELASFVDQRMRQLQ